MKKTSYSKHNPMSQKTHTINKGASPKKVGRGTMNLAKEATDAYAKNYGKQSQSGF